MFIGIILYFFISFSFAESIDLSETALLERVIPQLDRRLSESSARRDLAKRYFDGQGKSLKASFSRLEKSDLLSLSVIYAELHQLNISAEQRAVEAIKTPQYQALPEHIDTHRQKQRLVWDMENAVDALYRDLLTRISYRLKSYPSISSAGIQPLRDELAALRIENPVDPTNKDSVDLAAAILDEEKAYLALQEEILNFFALNQSDGFIDRVDNDLQMYKQATSFRKRSIIGRLIFAKPLLDSKRIQQIESLVLEEEQGVLSKRLSVIQKEFDDLKNASETIVIDRSKIPELERSRQEISDGLTELKGVELEIEMVRIAMIEHRLGVINNGVRQAEEEKVIASQQIQDDLLEAQQKLDAAKKEADAAAQKEQSMQLLLNEIVDLRSQLANLQAGEVKRRESFQEKSRLFVQSMTEIEEEVTDSIALPPLDPAKGTNIDKAFKDSHALVLEIQSEILVMRGQQSDIVESGQNLILELSNPRNDAPRTDSLFLDKLKDRDKSITDLIYAIETQERNFQNELEALFPLLLEAKRIRRLVQPHASSSALMVIRDSFESELVSEIVLFPLKMFAAYHSFVAGLKEVPKTALQVSKISGSFWLLISAVLFFFAWRFCRLNAYRFFLMGIEALQRLLWLRLSIQPEKVQLERDSFFDFSKRFIDILAVFMLSKMWEESAPFLSLTAYVTALLLMFRIAPVFIGMLQPLLSTFSKFDDQIQFDLFRSLQALFCWWMGFEALEYASISLLNADRLADIFNWLQSFAIFVIMFQLLKKWENLISAVALYHSEKGFLLKWLNRTSKGWFGIRLRALIGIIILMQQLLGWLKSLLIEGSSWVGSTIARRSIQQRDSTAKPLSKTIEETFLKTRADGILYEDEEAVLIELISGWKEEKSRGMVALVGDYASGKSEILKRIMELGHNDMRTKSIGLSDRLIDQQGAHEWLCAVFECSAHLTDTELITAINERESTLILVDDLHYAAFRNVGGYDALRYLLRIMQATSMKNFWLVAFHAHTWEFLEGAATPVNLSVFRSTVHIKPLTYLEMSQWLKARIQDAGFSLNFHRLAPKEASEKIIARAEMAYWRLLVDETGGNQSVAERYFIEGMSLGGSKNELEIGLFNSLPESDILNLVDLEKFVLMSILIHDGLRVDQLCHTLNEKTDLVETACRHLVGLGICRLEEEVLQVSLKWRPQVLRTLKKQRLLYAG